MKRYSLALIIREMQMKTTRRYHFIDVRMSIIIKLSKVGEDVEKRNPYTLLWDFKLVQLL